VLADQRQLHCSRRVGEFIRDVAKAERQPSSIRTECDGKNLLTFAMFTEAIAVLEIEHVEGAGRRAAIVSRRGETSVVGT
jgi:hypothetical protein